MKSKYVPCSLASELMDEEQPDATLVRKPIELICCAPGKELTFVQRRVLTAICQAVNMGNLESGDVISFSSQQLCTAVGFSMGNLMHLYRACMKIVDLKAWLNPLDLSSPPLSHRVFTGIAVRRGGVCFSLEPSIVELIRYGEDYAEVDPDTAKQLGAANPLALYELCLALLPDYANSKFPELRWLQLLTGQTSQRQSYRVRSRLIEPSANRLREVANLSVTLVNANQGRDKGYIGLKIQQLGKTIAARRGEGTFTKEDCQDMREEQFECEDPPSSSTDFKGVVGTAPSTARTNEVENFASDTEVQRASDDVHFFGPEVSRSVGAKSKETEQPYNTASTCSSGANSNRILSDWEAAHQDVLMATERLQHAKQGEREAAINVVRMLIGAYRFQAPELFLESEGWLRSDSGGSPVTSAT